MRPRSSLRRLVSPLIASGALAAATLGLTGLNGCYATDKGPEPPAASLYFPTGIAISPGGTALFLTNSDFDLQYTGGTVQAIDLARLRKRFEGTHAASAAADEILQAIDASATPGLLPIPLLTLS